MPNVRCPLVNGTVSGPDVGVTVIIPPAQVVAIVAVRRRNLVEHLLEICQCATLVLDGAQSPGRSRAKDGDDACLKPRIPDCIRDLGGDILDVGVPTGVDLQFLGDHHAPFSILQSVWVS